MPDESVASLHGIVVMSCVCVYRLDLVGITSLGKYRIWNSEYLKWFAIGIGWLTLGSELGS